MFAKCSRNTPFPHTNTYVISLPVSCMYVLYFNFFKDASPNSWMLVFIGGVYLLYLH